MQLVLVDVNETMVAEWRACCENLAGVSVRHGSIFEVACQALVSPANSYGFMDGGVDWSISEYFGWHVQERLQAQIKAQHHGELLVGMAEILPTDHRAIPYVIAAPTMRVPTALPYDTVNPYLAMRAILLLVKFGSLSDGRPIREVVETVAVTGLGTGVGRVSPRVCARQMRQAINDYLLDQAAFPASWLAAVQRQQGLSG